MAGRFPRRKVQARLQATARRIEPTKTGDEKVDRVFTELAAELNSALGILLRDAALVTFAVPQGGAELIIAHGLGRRAVGYWPVRRNRWAGSDFFFDRDDDNPEPHRELWLHVSVALETNLTLLVF